MRARLRHDLLRARAIEYFGPHLLVHRSHGFLTEMAERIADDLIRHLLVALTDDDVDCRLAADELRQRRHHDRIAELDPHAARLLERLWELAFLADLTELVAKVRRHPAGHLVLVGLLIVFGRCADRKTFTLGDDVEM